MNRCGAPETSRRRAEPVAPGEAPHLRLVPPRAVPGRANENAAVVGRIALQLLQPEFDVEDAIAQFSVEQQHVVASIAVANQAVVGDMPLRPFQHRRRRNGYVDPALQVAGAA